MLREILLRLPPQPSSLPRASAVCTRWRGLVSDPKFHRQFYAHHQNPPLLGVFEHRSEGIVFIPILDPPDRIPLVRMSLGRYNTDDDYGCEVLNCHHGLVLVHDLNQHEVVVCDPITGDQRRVAVPMKFRMKLVIVEAVLCAASDHGHVHGGCHLSPFKLVLVSSQRPVCRPLASVYSSETGLWGNLISTEATCQAPRPTALVGSYLYWFSYNGILEFDLAKNSLTMIRLPPVTNRIDYYENSQIIEAEDGVVGLAILSHHRFQLWKRTVNAHGVATLVPWKAIEMHSIPGLSPLIDGDLEGCMKAYDEDNDTIFIHAGGNVYGVCRGIAHGICQREGFSSGSGCAGDGVPARLCTSTADARHTQVRGPREESPGLWPTGGHPPDSVQLKLMQSRKLYESKTDWDECYCYPFKSFYTPGTTIAGEFNGADMLRVE